MIVILIFYSILFGDVFFLIVINIEKVELMMGVGIGIIIFVRIFLMGKEDVVLNVKKVIYIFDFNGIVIFNFLIIIFLSFMNNVYKVVFLILNM